MNTNELSIEVQKIDQLKMYIDAAVLWMYREIAEQLFLDELRRVGQPEGDEQEPRLVDVAVVAVDHCDVPVVSCQRPPPSGLPITGAAAGRCARAP